MVKTPTGCDNYENKRANYEGERSRIMVRDEDCIDLFHEEHWYPCQFALDYKCLSSLRTSLFDKIEVNEAKDKWDPFEQL